MKYYCIIQKLFIYIERSKTFSKPFKYLKQRVREQKNLYILFHLTFKLCVLPTLSIKIYRKFLG